MNDVVKYALTKLIKEWSQLGQFYLFLKMEQKKFKNPSPRIKVIQKIYNYLMNPNSEINYPKNQYKKFIKDVVSGTLERLDLIEKLRNNLK